MSFTKQEKSKFQIIKLDLEDSQAFIETLLNHPDPNPRMLTKAKEYQQKNN
jgi:uncharacterized protein (DUF1778 family)